MSVDQLHVAELKREQAALVADGETGKAETLGRKIAKLLSATPEAEAVVETAEARPETEKAVKPPVSQKQRRG